MEDGRIAPSVLIQEVLYQWATCSQRILKASTPLGQIIDSQLMIYRGSFSADKFPTCMICMFYFVLLGERSKLCMIYTGRVFWVRCVLCRS